MLLRNSTVKNINTINDLDLRKKTGCAIIAYKDKNGDYTVNPDEDLKVVSNSKIIVLGRSEQIEALNFEYDIL